MSKFKPTSEQEKVLAFDKKNLIVSASAGSGKTATLVEFIARLVEKGQPIKRILLLTFTKAASLEMKERLLQKFYAESESENIMDAIDDIPTADISTIHAFLERLIKKNTNVINISDGFVVLSEDESELLKKQAFDNCEKILKKSSEEDYNELYIRMHNDRDKIYKLLNDIMNFFSTQIEPEKKIEYYKASQKDFLQEAIEKINSKFINELKEIKKSLGFLKLRLDDEKYTIYIDKISSLLNFNQEAFDLYKNIITSDIKAPGTSKKVDALALFDLKEEYKKFKEIKDTLITLNIDKDFLYDVQKFGRFENIIYNYYIIYNKTFQNIKEKINAVDFNDLERFASEILSNEEIKQQLQTNYDYIFIDEYQDTNYVQESLVKEIAKEAHFIAVGDPKQGIYGFRNATSEIIKKDIKAFEESENSSAEFLRKNFRSNKNILNFVNNVFVNVMKENTVGIDYQSTSMLEAGGDQNKQDESLPSVKVDIVSKNQSESEESIQDVYDILKDECYKKSSKNMEARVIATRIEELMLKSIYDAKIGAMRNITFKDIVILTRGKSELVQEIIKELAFRNIPVVSDIKGNFKDYAEIHVFINLFKIMLDFNDDVALLSVMLSKIGGFTVDEIANIRLNAEEKEFYNVVRNSTDEKVQNFLNQIEKLKTKFEIVGAYITVQDLLKDCEYRPYLLSKENAENEIFILDKFLEQLKKAEFQFDLPRLVSFLEREKIDFKGGGSSGNAISISTIHSSKGLEYPVVILADTGKEMLHANTSQYAFNTEIGLAINYFSREDDEVYLTPLVYMSKLKQKEKERNDEIMLLYVALTRAQNHLLITGTTTDKKLREICKAPIDARSYLEMILSSYKKLITFDTKVIEEESVESNFITEIEQLSFEHEKYIGTSDKKVCQEIEKYFNFEYPFKSATKTIFKNSATSLNQSEEKKFEFVGESDSIERGNAYHLALKLIDFNKINTVEDVKTAIENLYDDSINKYVNVELLYNNIVKIKEAIGDAKQVYKEQQFTSIVNLLELFEDGQDEEIMLQGVVDLFALGKNNVLIDYKFTSDKDEKSIINRYKKQLILYKKAIEDAFEIKVDKVYLMSLKNNKLINF